jgi:Zn-finger nucleic acid-binding protein
MNCPVDDTTLVMSDRQGIEIDYCPTCRGVWLDRGELDQLIERENRWIEDRDDEGRHEAKSAEPPKKKKKVKSLFQDLMEGIGGGE